MAQGEVVDLTNCDREPIHIPGSIQPHGCLLVCDANLTVVQRHSQNAAEFLGCAGADLNGRPLEEIIGRRATHQARNAQARSSDPAAPGLHIGLGIAEGDAKLDLAVHRQKGVSILEFETSGAGEAFSAAEMARSFILRLRQVAEIDDLLEKTPRLIRGLFGYDRVMIYKFAHDGAGQVISEAKRADVEPFLGLHYPASDIPRQARELYLKNTIRIIRDARAEVVPIVPETDASGEPLDLSFAHLRSVSPIHCEYLRNMGVVASMSTSIVVGGELWGLIACHHFEPRKLSMAARVAAEMFGNFFSLHLEGLENKRKVTSASRARKMLDELVRHAGAHLDVAQFLRSNIRNLGTLMPCDGVGLWLGGEWSCAGSSPPAQAVPALAGFVANAADGQVWATSALSDLLPAAVEYRAEASGVFAIPLSQIPGDYLFFFRKEIAQTVNWAGNPDQHYETGPHGDRLTPRKSFAIWKQTVERQSVPWTQSDREVGQAARIGLLEVVMRNNELLAEERRKSELRQKMLNQELNHRVKNILALIKSLVSYPAEADRTLEDYVASLKGRIEALAYAHDQVMRGGGALRDLLEAEIAPFRGTAGRVTLEGPAVRLDARAFSVMALVVHELVTNAAKYGALSVQEGHLDVRWTVDANENCEIIWTESGGPPVQAPAHRGLGSVLVERSIPFDLDGKSEVHYAPEGVRCRFLIPSKHAPRGEPAERARLEDPGTNRASQVAPLEGMNVLLVEDQLIIAVDAERMLAEKGAKAIEMAASVAEALSKLSQSEVDVAVLDINLGSETSLSVAEELMRRDIPFVLATGYGDSAMIPDSMREVPIVRKPYESETLAGAIRQAVGSESDQ